LNIILIIFNKTLIFITILNILPNILLLKHYFLNTIPILINIRPIHIIIINHINLVHILIIIIHYDAIYGFIQLLRILLLILHHLRIFSLFCHFLVVLGESEVLLTRFLRCFRDISLLFRS
jgi:hypothetical protein